MSNLVKNFNLNGRYDLQVPSVQIFYEMTGSVDGTEVLNIIKDFYPNPIPTDPAKQFAALQFTVDLQGVQSSATQVNVEIDEIDPTNIYWWLDRHPQYTPYDSTDPSDAQNNIASISIDVNSLQRSPNPTTDNGQVVVDKGYKNELTKGQIAGWMSVDAQRLTFSIKANVVYRDGTKPHEINLTYQCLSTNAVTKTYVNNQVQAYPEPVPVGLAQFIYNAMSPLQHDGEIVTQEEDVSGTVLIGNVVNLTGGALAEWATMKATVQSITEDIDTGETSIQLGVPPHLNAGELVDILRVNRLRLIRSNFSMRQAGTPSNTSGDVELGDNTPEKNSVSGTASHSTHVISATVDGSGSSVTHTSDGQDCSSFWGGQTTAPGSPPPWPGSISIKLSDCDGFDLKIQGIKVCLNGVTGTIYGLFSDFIPDE